MRRNIIIPVCSIVVIISMMMSCHLQEDWSGPTYEHYQMRFKIGNILYSVVGTYNKLPLSSLRCIPTEVGAVLTRTRYQGHFFYEGLMKAEYEKEDTLAIGARLTTTQYSMSRDGSLFFFLPFSRVQTDTPITVPTQDVYFFQGGDHPSERAVVLSFTVSFSEVILMDSPDFSVIKGDFTMSGVDINGCPFKTVFGKFDVLNDTSLFNPMVTIEEYEEQFDK